MLVPSPAIVPSGCGPGIKVSGLGRTASVTGREGTDIMLVGATYKTRLTKKEYVAEGTMAFYFEKPYDFFFKPGQYVDVTLVNPEHTDEEGNIRSFSIASTPADPFLMLVTRMRDTAFKRSLDAMLSKNEVLF